jgi:hypothetical protein
VTDRDDRRGPCFLHAKPENGGSAGMALVMTKKTGGLLRSRRFVKDNREVI